MTAVSVTRLSVIDDKVHQLRARLRAAYVHDEPRQQRDVYVAVCELIEDYVRPYLDAVQRTDAQQQQQQREDEAHSVVTADDDDDDKHRDDAAAAAARRVEGAFVTLHYLQDVLCALLLLLPAEVLHTCAANKDDNDEDDGDDSATSFTLDAATMPSMRPTSRDTTSSSLSSSHYVSHGERMCCARVFFYLCLVQHNALPAHHILAALYPLLDTNSPVDVTSSDNNSKDSKGSMQCVARDSASSRALANATVPNVLRARRCASAALLLSRVLHGFVRARAEDGVRALLRVLVLDDRVTADGVVDACGFVVRLLTRCDAQAVMWWATTTTVTTTTMTAMTTMTNTRRSVRIALRRVCAQEQVRHMASQLLPLLACHADTPLTRDGDDVGNDGDGARADVAWARRLQEQQRQCAQQQLPRETLEERLHLCVSMLIDAVVQLPLRATQEDTHTDTAAATAATATYARAYARLYWYNVYLLTPAFGALSLRIRATCEDTDTSSTSSQQQQQQQQSTTTWSAHDEVPHDVMCAVWRVLAVVSGAMARPAARGVVCVLEATAPGLLCLAALLSSTVSTTTTTATTTAKAATTSAAQLRVALRRVWAALYAGALPLEMLARVLVHACVAPTRYTYAWTQDATDAAKDNTTGNEDAVAAATTPTATRQCVRLCRVTTSPCACATRLRGLVAVVYDTDDVVPAALQTAVLVALADACSAARMQAADARVADDDDVSTTTALRRCVEHVCMTAAAECVCGGRHVLHEMLTTLRAVAPLSRLCLRWVCALTPRLLLQQTQQATSNTRHSDADDDDHRCCCRSSSEDTWTEQQQQPSAWLRAYTADVCASTATTRQSDAPTFASSSHDEARAQLQHALTALRSLIVQQAADAQEEQQQQQQQDDGDDDVTLDEEAVTGALRALDRALAEVAAATALAQRADAQREDTTAAAAARQAAALQRSWRDAAAQLTWALDAHSPATQAVALLQLSTSVEEATWRMCRHTSNNNNTTSSAASVAEHLRPLVVAQLLPTLMRALVEVDDACAAVAAVRCVAWLVMYRLDAADSSVFTALLRAVLSAPPQTDHGDDSRRRRHDSNGASVRTATATRTATTVWRAMGVTGVVVDAARVARTKARVLDVLLCFCDYDACAQTLRNIDDCLAAAVPRQQQQRQGRGDGDSNSGGTTSNASACAHSITTPATTLYALLVRCCQRDEAAVVQVAALHLLGSVAVQLHTRIALRDVCSLARDVFRHTTVDMAKAACAAMLHHVACTLHTRDAVRQADVAELRAMAMAMSSYYSAPRSHAQQQQASTAAATTTRDKDGDDASGWAQRGRRERSCALSPSQQQRTLHDELVRQHGRDTLALLQSLATHALLAHDDDDDDDVVLRCSPR